jgi:1,4-dihydroxy-2-naphthoate octaprenyltransferase
MLKALIKSMRLRTLPLSLGGVLCGGCLGMAFLEESNYPVLALTALTACLLQILSNFSNEMGDYRQGVDGERREGPAYGMADGMTEKQLWTAINTTVVACAVSGLALVWVSGCSWWVLLLGAAAIWAATHYTLGSKPYGYIGLGDLFVFIFFGLVSVLGSFYVITHTIFPHIWLFAPAVGLGLLSVAVLNVNNIRDMKSDEGFRKTTPLRLGERGAKVYQTLLVVLGVACFAWTKESLVLVVLPVAPFFLWHIIGVWRRTGKRLDPMLPLLVISTFVMSVWYGFEFYVECILPWPVW